jgi:hypothetical protein
VPGEIEDEQIDGLHPTRQLSQCLFDPRSRRLIVDQHDRLGNLGHRPQPPRGEAGSDRLRIVCREAHTGRQRPVKVPGDTDGEHVKSRLFARGAYGDDGRDRFGGELAVPRVAQGADDVASGAEG